MFFVKSRNNNTNNMDSVNKKQQRKSLHNYIHSIRKNV